MGQLSARKRVGPGLPSVEEALAVQQVHDVEIGALKKEVWALHERICALESDDRVRDAPLPLPADGDKGHISRSIVQTDGVVNSANEIWALLRRVKDMSSPRERLERETLETLRGLCKMSGLTVSGLKADVVERLDTKGIDPIIGELAHDYRKVDLQAACASAAISISGNKYELALRLFRARDAWRG